MAKTQHQQTPVNITEPIRVIIEKSDRTKFNWGLALSIFIPSIVSIWTLFQANKISATRERENKLRDEMIIYAIQTYNDLNDAIILSPKNDSTAFAALDKAFSRIQLFGDSEQIDMVMNYGNVIARANKRQETDITPLVVSIRDELRKQLLLPNIDSPAKHISYAPK